MAWPSNSFSFLLLAPSSASEKLSPINPRAASFTLSLPTTEEVFCEITPPPLLAAKTDSERASGRQTCTYGSWLNRTPHTHICLPLPSSSDPFSERVSGATAVIQSLNLNARSSTSPHLLPPPLRPPPPAQNPFHCRNGQKEVGAVCVSMCPVCRPSPLHQGGLQRQKSS